MKLINDGYKIIISSVEMESILYIDETTDISGNMTQPLKLCDLFNKYL